MSWKETGGPPVQPPTQHGFGSTLIERSLPPYPGTSAHTEYAADGVSFTARLALDD